MNRHDKILELARDTGRVLVDDLASQLGVSVHTIRRDINTLCEQSKLRRLHGGAEILRGNMNLPYPMRNVLNIEAKQAIAEEIAKMVPDGSTLFFSVGTTLAVIASALLEHQSLTLVTNNLNAALILSENKSNRIIIPGGELRLPDRDILGATATNIFSTYRADFGIFGVGGIDEDGSLMDFHQGEVASRQAILANSRASILVADQTKFGRIAPAIGDNIKDAQNIVLDKPPPAEFSNIVDMVSDKLIIAQEVSQ